METAAPSTLPRRVVVTDVVCRDGFQDEARIIATEDKLALLAQLVRAGVQSIEATSFVHPKVVPQMADAAGVLAGIRRREGVSYAALTPNLQPSLELLADVGSTMELKPRHARNLVTTLGRLDGRPVGFVGSSARHHELGPIALALVKRNVPVDAPLVVDGMPAAQEVVVDPEVGLHVRPLR